MIFLDFETFYDSKNKYSLKNISMVEYIRNPQFKVFGCGVKQGDNPTRWITANDLPSFFRTVQWDQETVIAQNAKFDGSILEWHYGHKPKAYIDTLAMSKAVFGNSLVNHSLATVAAKYGLAPKGFLPTDGVKTLTPELEKALADYCIHDVDLCYQIYKRLQGQFPFSEYFHVDWTIKAFIRPSLVLNAQTLSKIYEEESNRRKNIFSDIGTGKDVFASNKKFPELLRARGFEVPMKRSPRTGKLTPALSVGDPDFREMIDSENDELRTLCEARLAAKSCLLETRSLKFLEISKLGVFPFDVCFSGAQQTHRYAGGKGAGGNPQNIPKKSELRAAIGVKDGYKLLVADFSNIELRIVAWLANELRLITPITYGADVYCEFASKIYGREITSDDDAERQFGKTAMLGLQYSMGPTKFKNVVRIQIGRNIDKEEAERVVYLYREYYAKIPKLWEKLDRIIPLLGSHASMPVPFSPFLRMELGSLVLPSGLRLKYPNLRTDDGEWVFDVFRHGSKIPVKSKLYGGKLLENVSQALAGEICKAAIKRCVYSGLMAVGQVHDEILVVCRKEDTERSMALFQSAMTEPLPWWPSLKLDCEIGMGNNWKEAKQWLKKKKASLKS